MFSDTPQVHNIPILRKSFFLRSFNARLNNFELINIKFTHNRCNLGIYNFVAER